MGDGKNWKHVIIVIRKGFRKIENLTKKWSQHTVNSYHVNYSGNWKILKQPVLLWPYILSLESGESGKPCHPR